LPEEPGNEAEGTKDRLSFTGSGRVEGRGYGRYNDLVNEFSRKRGKRHGRERGKRDRRSGG